MARQKNSIKNLLEESKGSYLNDDYRSSTEYLIVSLFDTKSKIDSLIKYMIKENGKDYNYWLWFFRQCGVKYNQLP